MPPTRDPFSFPHYENEDTYTGKNRSSQKTPYAVPTHLAQQRDPWNRLHATPTLASIRREIWYSEPEVSRDSLDFNLSALYNHHEDLLKDKSKVVLHKETIFDDHGVLKGLEPVKERTAPPIQRPTSRGISVRHWVNPIKESIHSIEGAIESPHTAATNSGYSRKENGGIFYH
ncbi:cilia- and flagella-associated protein 276 [Rhineura floridana]|uniref:cilia- and flagella-associated protein 276 n=1 Tax=Rhineura floridana TaxID=261503 RepID=UPI002AC7EC9D|nr:cilia- and flagella-associated protein 276 [Rhineura floridana]